MIPKLFTRKSSWEKRYFEVIADALEYYRSQLGFPTYAELDEQPAKRKELLEKFYIESIPHKQGAEHQVTLKENKMRMKKFLQQFDSSHNVSSENEDKYNFASRSLNNILDAMFHLGLKILENDAYLTTENNETE